MNYSNKGTEHLYDSYIIKELKRTCTGYITKKMISDKRKQLIHHRNMKAVNFDLNDDRKYCWRCETLYLNRYENFAKVKSTYDKLDANCLKCKKEKRKIDYDKHKSNYIKKACEWQSENKDKRVVICKRNNDKYKDCSKHQQMKKNIKTKYYKTEKGKKQIFTDNLRTLFRYAMKTYSGKGKIMSSKKYGIDYNKCFIKLEKEAKSYGYTIEEMRKMNYHVDHIIPTILYNFNDIEEIRKCWNPLNLRWLSQHENCTKGGNIRPQDLEVIKTLPENIYPKGTARNSLVVFQAAVNRNPAIAGYYKL